MTHKGISVSSSHLVCRKGLVSLCDTRSCVLLVPVSTPPTVPPFRLRPHCDPRSGSTSRVCVWTGLRRGSVEDRHFNSTIITMDPHLEVRHLNGNYLTNLVRDRVSSYVLHVDNDARMSIDFDVITGLDESKLPGTVSSPDVPWTLLRRRGGKE